LRAPFLRFLLLLCGFANAVALVMAAIYMFRILLRRPSYKRDH